MGPTGRVRVHAVGLSPSGSRLAPGSCRGQVRGGNGGLVAQACGGPSTGEERRSPLATGTGDSPSRAPGWALM